MTEEHEYSKNVTGGPGITAGGNVSIGDVSGQFGAGEHIKQIQIGQTDLEELRKSLNDFQKGITKLGLSSNYENVVNGEISAAIIEAEKGKPALSKIKEKFESTIYTVKGTGKAINDISELYEPAKKIAQLVGISLPFLL